MPSSEYLINLLGIVSSVAVFLLVIALVLKMDRIKQLQLAVNNLKKSLDEMDEQAKLIVRTDIELNKTQEELDKKINGLYSLQRLSRAISSTLEESRILKMIKPSSIEELGFSKAAGFLWNDNQKNFTMHSGIGYPKEEIGPLQLNIDADKGFYSGLIQQEKTVSSISLQEDSLKEKIKNTFKTTSFVISPILAKEGSKGFLFVGTEKPDAPISEGDEELITILASQVGQALENARLFEKTWRAQQELERKVRERTQELNAVLNEVKTISKRKSDFISAVSHELRTPLTSIKGYASILLAGKLGELPEDVRLRLDKINRHSDELTHLVNGLLDIARIESGKIIMNKQVQDLHGIIAEINDLLSVQLKEKQIDFSYSIGKDAHLVTADAGQIKRVFINLIGNAVKFTPLKGKISVTSRKQDDTVQIDVSDNGCGVPEEAKERIFEEFYRVDNPINEQVKGSGLGLTLVKNIIEAHNGKIWVESKAGEGSTFSFILPQNK